MSAEYSFTVTDEIRFDTDDDVTIAVGSLLTDGILDRWTREQLTGLNGHVRFSHTKFMLVNPLSDDPLVITGSGNFSDPSVRALRRRAPSAPTRTSPVVWVRRRRTP